MLVISDNLYQDPKIIEALSILEKDYNQKVQKEMEDTDISSDTRDKNIVILRDEYE
jgi:hypothetical protein